MIGDILILISGLALLIVGADYVTDGAVSVARRFKVSNLMIGLTVVLSAVQCPTLWFAWNLHFSISLLWL